MNEKEISQTPHSSPAGSGALLDVSRPQATEQKLPTWRDDLPPMRRSKVPFIIFLFLVLVGLSATLFLLEYERRNKPVTHSNLPPKSSSQIQSVPTVMPSDAANRGGEIPKADEPMATITAFRDPFELVSAIADALARQDVATAERLIGTAALPSENVARLRAMTLGQDIKLREPHPVRQVGEIEINRRVRYAIELAAREPGRDRIYIDLTKNAGLWGIEKLTLPPSLSDPIQRVIIPDALGVTDAFLLAVLNQDFPLAKEFVNTSTVSDATLAGLCILFEEGNYKLRSEKPIRATIQKPQIAIFLANVVAANAADPQNSAQFGLTLRKHNPNSAWIIDELNLDHLLLDYASRFAGGDVFYTPLAKNPAGGDTLVLYFDFATNELTPRTQRQIAIVGSILQLDARKKLTISGHTDSVGSRDFNQQLSNQRAIVVRDFLIKCGVAPSQVITAAKGLSEPRRPNVTATGQDDPQGRRANRRSEIYLDF